MPGADRLHDEANQRSTGPKMGMMME